MRNKNFLMPNPNLRKKMIGKHRAVFSSTMDENRFLSGDEMSIKLKDLKACNNLYCVQASPSTCGHEI